MDAAISIVSSLGLVADEAIILQDSNKLTLRLLPCDVLARVAPVAPVELQCAQFEVELAHAPEEVGEQYPGANQDVLRECRILVLAMITTWRWDRDDQFPNGRQLGAEWLNQLRAARDLKGLDTHR